jgi:pSer/pThr/pTyr-binding forkhead associated (FHA) protein
MPYCSQCGSQNADDAKFCSQCGSRLAPASGPSGGEARPEESTATIPFGAPKTDGDDHPALNEADAAAVNALPAGSALLVVLRGPGSGSRYLLDTDKVTAGRHPESDIFLDDFTVSRRHAEFTRSEGTFRVTDVGSLNGTYVNMDRIDDVLLQNGDEVRIGKFRLVFFAGASGS